LAILPSNFNTVQIWRPPFSEEPVGIKCGLTLASAQCSPVGSSVAVGTDENTVEIWDAKTQTKARVLDKHTGKGKVRAVAYSYDGSLLASLSTHTSETPSEVIVWDTSDYHVVGRIVAHDGFAKVLTFFPDGRRFATGGNTDGLVKVWRIAVEGKE
jgi:WD40 repeat protein